MLPKVVLHAMRISQSPSLILRSCSLLPILQTGFLSSPHQDLLLPETSKRHFRVHSTVQGRRSAKIAGKKSAEDSRKSKSWGKIAKQVLQAVKADGPAVETNARLKEVLYQAKLLGVPKDVIERNMKKATDKDQADFTEIIYEAYGPAATGYIVECLTDNVNRSASQVRNALLKGGGKMAEKGSVVFNFARKGQLVVPDCSLEDEVLEATMSVADDCTTVFEDGICTGVKVITSVEGYGIARQKLLERQLVVDDSASGLVYQPLEEPKKCRAAGEAACN